MGATAKKQEGSLTAASFFSKYNLTGWKDEMDRDPDQPGIQSPGIDIDRFIADYETLSPANRYAVFMRLERGGEWSLLGRMLALSPDLPVAGGKEEIIQSAGDRINSVARQLSHDLGSLSDFSDPWAARLLIRQALLTMAFVRSGANEALGYSETPFNVGIDAKEATEILEETYAQVWPNKEAVGDENPLWDSDGDFDPYDDPKNWETYFDDRDCEPLNGTRNRDGDGDGVCADLDPNDADPRSWSKLKIGETRRFSDFDLRRTSENHHEILVRIRIEADSPDLEATYINRVFLARRQEELGRLFGEMMEGNDGATFSLKVDFFADDPHHVAIIDGLLEVFEERGNSLHWSRGIIENPWINLHEVMHLIGFPDLYTERDVRDMGLVPRPRAMDHIMVCLNKLPGREMKNLVADLQARGRKAWYLLAGGMVTGIGKEDFIAPVYAGARVYVGSHHSLFGTLGWNIGGVKNRVVMTTGVQKRVNSLFLGFHAGEGNVAPFWAVSGSLNLDADAKPSSFSLNGDIGAVYDGPYTARYALGAAILYVDSELTWAPRIGLEIGF